MHIESKIPARAVLAGALTLMAFTATPVLAAGTDPGAGSPSSPSSTSTAAQFQRDRADCVSGKSSEDVQTCLREARAAYAQARRSGLDHSAKPYQLNESLRCEPLPDADRRDCQARMQGEGTTSGSVASGGIYRELRTIEPADPSDPDSAPR